MLPMSLHDDSSLCCEVALRLLDEYDRADRQWIDTVRVKIDAAVAMSEHTLPIDGETLIAGICDRFRQVRESKQGYTN